MNFLILIFVLISNISFARNTVKPSLEAVKAIVEAANQYKINANDLVRIAYVESRFNANAIRNNTNNTVDIGMFQVNSVHWTTTCKGIDIMTLKGNALCAAKIISKHKKHARSDKNWLGRYHSKTLAKKLFYVKLLANVDVSN